MREKIQRKAEVISAPFRKLYDSLNRKIAKINEAHGQKFEKINRVLNRGVLIFHVLWSVIIMILIEGFSRHSFGAAFRFMLERPLVFFYNSFLIFTTFMLVFFFRRRAFVRVLLTVIWIVAGFANGVVLKDRVTPFTAQDFRLLDDLKNIITKYVTVGELIKIVILIVVAVIGLLVFWKIGPKYRGKMHYIRNSIATALVIFSFVGVTNLALEHRVLSSYFGNIAFAYKDYGFPYCFGCTLIGTGMDKPYGYGKDSIDPLTVWEDEVPEELPNIIFVQLESFFDVSTVEYLRCSKDPLPNFRKLSKEYSSGTYKVPSIGAGTANTEFETISGMNMRYFGPGEYPHKTILLKTTCDSVPYSLKQIGYSTHAIHNNIAGFYSRNEVFSNLGFDTFTSMEYMDDSERTETGWMKDQVLVDCVMDCLQSTEEQDYVFTISVQGHGDYPREKLLENPEITVSGAIEKERLNQWEYYVNQVYEMDQFVADLITAVDSLEEDSVIVFYGDHLPTMNLTEEEVTNRYLFDTSYLIWNNMGLEKKDQTLCAYQVGAEVLNQLDIHVGQMVKYHQNRRGTKHYLRDMETIQYDLLYGKGYAYGENGAHEPTQMVMGVKNQMLKEVQQTEEKLYVIGENFTTSTKVYINGKYQDTEYVNPQQLAVEAVWLTDGDVVSIKQVSEDGDVLSEEGAFVYKEAK